MPVRPSTAGEAPRALVTGHYQSLSPVTFSGAPRVVDHFHRLLTDAASVLRTSAKLQLLTVPARELGATADDGRAAPLVAVLELLARTAAETPLEAIQACNDVRRPWSAPVGSGRPPVRPAKGKGKGTGQGHGQGSGAGGDGGSGNGQLPPRAPESSAAASATAAASAAAADADAASTEQRRADARPDSGSSKSSSRPGSGKKVSFNAAPTAPTRESAPRSAGLPARERKSTRDKRLETPLGKAIEFLHELKMRSLDDETVDIIDAALECLADSNELLNPKLTDAEPTAPSPPDAETQEWLVSNYMERFCGVFFFFCCRWFFFFFFFFF
jgi:hypothetical protein